MAKLVDAPASGAGDRKVVEVRVLFWAPNMVLMSLLLTSLIIETFEIKLLSDHLLVFNKGNLVS
jgi:Flp pilus assembly protein protease CpaA